MSASRSKRSTTKTDNGQHDSVTISKRNEAANGKSDGGVQRNRRHRPWQPARSTYGRLRIRSNCDRIYRLGWLNSGDSVPLPALYGRRHFHVKRRAASGPRSNLLDIGRRWLVSIRLIKESRERRRQVLIRSPDAMLMSRGRPRTHTNRRGRAGRLKAARRLPALCPSVDQFDSFWWRFQAISGRLASLTIYCTR